MTFRKNKQCLACGGTGTQKKVEPKTRLKTIGQRFGIVTVTSLAGRNQRGALIYNYVCDCGNTGVSDRGNLSHTRAKVRSCGCIKNIKIKKRNKTHGLSDSDEYEIWTGIKKRCFSKKSKSYKDYGGRGIGMSSRWNHFSAFLKDMGKRPSKNHSIDRIDNNGDYSKENCRWSTHDTQMNNTRKNIYVIHEGKKVTVSQYAKITGKNYEKERVRFHKEGKIHRAV